jgi:hypothetical protein
VHLPTYQPSHPPCFLLTHFIPLFSYTRHNSIDHCVTTPLPFSTSRNRHPQCPPTTATHHLSTRRTLADVPRSRARPSTTSLDAQAATSASRMADSRPQAPSPQLPPTPSDGGYRSLLSAWEHRLARLRHFYRPRAHEPTAFLVQTQVQSTRVPLRTTTHLPPPPTAATQQHPLHDG